MGTTWMYNNSNGQGIVYDAKSGENIAVVYDSKNAKLLSYAQEMFAVLKELFDKGFTINNTLGQETCEKINSIVTDF